ncbi:MAG TPA: cytochrome c3 family protein [Gammaproteobacteria bacterium]|nr:cytochrome c3 family protein [Gammaproteobacteria bacterium]
MSQTFSQWMNPVGRVLLVALVASPFAIVGVAMAVVRSDFYTGANAALDQPIPFSHAHHVGDVGLDCRYCHYSVERSEFAGIPDTRTCMTCHSQIWTGAAMLEPVRASLRTGEPLRWTRVHDLPDYVYFSHRIHVAKGVGCETCHGRVDRMPLIRPVRAWHMQDCLECHRDPAPRLRPAAAVFTLGYTRAAGDPSPAELVRGFGIDVDRLDDCSICHR